MGFKVFHRIGNSPSNLACGNISENFLRCGFARSIEVLSVAASYESTFDWFRKRAAECGAGKRFINQQASVMLPIGNMKPTYMRKKRKARKKGKKVFSVFHHFPIVPFSRRGPFFCRCWNSYAIMRFTFHGRFKWRQMAAAGWLAVGDRIVASGSDESHSPSSYISHLAVFPSISLCSHISHTYPDDVRVSVIGFDRESQYYCEGIKLHVLGCKFQIEERQKEKHISRHGGVRRPRRIVGDFITSDLSSSSETWNFPSARCAFLFLSRTSHQGVIWTANIPIIKEGKKLVDELRCSI